jgi:hypothetical protein
LTFSELLELFFHSQLIAVYIIVQDLTHTCMSLNCVIFTELQHQRRQSKMTPKKVAKMVAEMLRRNELRLSRGYSGRYYLYYFDETKTEPFRAVMLPMNNE